MAGSAGVLALMVCACGPSATPTNQDAAGNDAQAGADTGANIPDAHDARVVDAPTATDAGVPPDASADVAPPPPPRDAGPLPDGGPGPALTPGVWTDITPPGISLMCCGTGGGLTFGVDYVEIDPGNPSTIYAAIDQQGLWKSLNGGATWARMGDATQTGETATHYLDSPIAVRVDPNDSLHLYATQGVRGQTLGFWVSRDGGETWTRPAGFSAVAATLGTGPQSVDVTTLAIDPSDFRHILVGYHSPWNGMSNHGFIESPDGGDTWTVHAPQPTWPAGSTSLSFLYEPAQGIGDARTWLVGTDDSGLWRTADGGTTWTRVADYGIAHGGADVYYGRNGALYMGGFQYPIRSTDNGMTWQQLSDGTAYATYYTIRGDGNSLYTQVSYTGDNGGHGPQPYLVSPETDGVHWTAYQNGAQTFSDGPFVMRFDPVHRIMYSANWDAGLFALRVIDP